MKIKNLLTRRGLSHGLLTGLAITACALPELNAAAGGISAYSEQTDPSSFISTSSPVYLPGQWSMATGGRLRGFVRPANGLNVAASANVYIDLFEPLSGQLKLGNASTLNLESDLFLTSSASLAVGTTSGHKASIGAAQAATIHMGGDISIPAERTLQVTASSLTLDGQGFTCSFAGQSAALRINSGKILTLRNMVLNGLEGAEQIKGPGTLVLQNCVVNLPETTWTASWGNVRILVADDVVFRGGGKFTFGSASSLTVSANSMLSFDNNTTFSFAPQDKSRNRLYFGDRSSILRLSGSTFCAPGQGGFQGVSLLKGTLVLDNKVTFSNSNNHSLAKAFTIGNGSESSDLAIRLNAGASINLDCGAIDYQNVDA